LVLEIISCKVGLSWGSLNAAICTNIVDIEFLYKKYKNWMERIDLIKLFIL
jgi:hypothetical protein